MQSKPRKTKDPSDLLTERVYLTRRVKQQLDAEHRLTGRSPKASGQFAGVLILEAIAARRNGRATEGGE